MGGRDGKKYNQKQPTNRTDDAYGCRLANGAEAIGHNMRGLCGVNECLISHGF